MACGLGQKGQKQYRKRSEGLFRQMDSADRENRHALTGYKPLKQEEPSLKETMRLENPCGTLAFGGDEKKHLALVATQKRETGGKAAGERERVLKEEGWRERPLGQNRTFANPGKREDGAFGFQMQPSMTRTQMMGQLKKYMDSHDQKTLRQMLPFLVTGKDLKEKEQLEEAVRLGRRLGAGRQPQEADRLLEEKKQELVQKKQMESRFGQKLEKAASEEKKTVWELQKPAPGLRRRLEAALDEEGQPEDEERPEDGAQPEKENGPGPEARG